MFFRTVLGSTLCCAAIAATTIGTAAAATVEVRVSGVSPGKGKVNVAVCDRERFLKQCSHSGSAPAKAAEAPSIITTAMIARPRRMPFVRSF